MRRVGEGKEEGSGAFVVGLQQTCCLLAGRGTISSAGSWESLTSWRRQLQLQVKVEVGKRTVTNWNVDRAVAVDSAVVDLIAVVGTVGIVEKAGEVVVVVAVGTG